MSSKTTLFFRVAGWVTSLTWALRLVAADAPGGVVADSAISYQGRLVNGGAPASGSFDFVFTLRDAASGGNSVGEPLRRTLTVNGGIFSASLDFPAASFTGVARWVEVRVRPTPAGGSEVPDSESPFAVLERQRIQSVPYAFRAVATASAAEVGAGVPQAAAVLVAQAVSEQNAIKSEAVSVTDPVEAIRRIAQVQAVAQQEAIQAIERIAANPVGLDAFAIAFTGESLEGAVDKAPIGDITGGSTAPGKFSFQDAEMVIAESGEASVPITVLRKEGSSGVVLIDVVFSPSAGLQTNRVRLRFADGEIRKTVEPGLILVNDGVSEPEVRHMVSLTLVDGSPTRPGFGSPAKGAVTVIDDDSPGEIGFGANRYRILEGGWGSAPIVLERRGGTAGRVVVRVGLASSTAVLGSDFSENRVTVVFESGERIRIVPLPLVDDVQPEALEELSLTLSLDPQSASGARLVDGATSAEVLVEDDDTPPRLELHPGPAGGPRLLCVGPVGLGFVLETSTDLRLWKRMSGGRVTTDGFTSPIVFPLVGTIPGVAFYRLVLP